VHVSNPMVARDLNCQRQRADRLPMHSLRTSAMRVNVLKRASMLWGERMICFGSGASTGAVARDHQGGWRAADAVRRDASSRIPCSIQQIARLYAFQHDPQYADVLTRPGANGPVGTAFVAPKVLRGPGGPARGVPCVVGGTLD